MPKAPKKNTKATKKAAPSKAAAKSKTKKRAVAKSTKKPIAKKVASKNVKAFYRGVGRRKTAVARVRLSRGTGLITINGKKLTEFFVEEVWQQTVRTPLEIVGHLKDLDVSVLTHGGGIMGQAEAVRHGVARALENFDAKLRPSLKKAGLLTRDAREKERKKYGLKGARRAPQFSKR